MRRRIRLMIVDDSTVARAVLSRMVESDPAFEISAVAGTAEDAIEALGECRVDIVILDLEMPGAGGLKSIPRIIAAAGGAKVMIVSSLAEDGAEQTVAALALGAADTMPKPGTGRFNGKFSEILLEQAEGARLRDAGRRPAPPMRHKRTGRSAAAGDAERPDRRAGHRCFDRRHPCARRPVSRAAEADRRSDPRHPASAGPLHGGVRTPARCDRAAREAVVAEDGMALEPDHILVAPGDAHLTLEPGKDGAVVRLTPWPQRAAAACRRSIRCSRRSAPSTAPARSASC